MPSASVSKFKIETLVLQSTPFCNIDCSYCYLPDRTSKALMSEQTLERAFSRVFSSPFLGDHLTVLWHAGEPLVAGVDYYRHAFDILERCKPSGVSVTCHFQTNGTLLTQAWVDFLADSSSKIGLSIDGPADLHDRTRKTRSGNGTFQRSMQGLRLLQKNNLPFHVITVLTKESLGCPDKLFEFYVENDIRQVAFNVEEIEGVHSSSSLQSQDSDRQMKEFLRRFLDLLTERRPKLSIREFDGAFHAIVNPKSADYGNPMAEPMRFVSVGVDGDISTFSPELLGTRSCRYPSFAFGNVHADALVDVLTNPIFKEVNSDIQAGIQGCRNSCQYFDVCLGGVPGNKLFENGSFATCETLFCRLAKKAVVDVVLERVERNLGLT
ncbi:cyclophane-forming radical SAM/SPASM peptide maturase GrrM/OscB [Bradyrhizobium sp. CSS354]|uniref:cyclophane-forming radical SAM/SPASM peptide maturase GrrM/OscB n=1 Tax=Bradyrhizobium sp. CSS354 TaxID=2699172 RepID=UPI0023B1A68E|nr:cyclophane-forming radical SAM/SPASM peptide maturase GrrM/OscB [Bradyrhizobium sp. CSS354]MDE5461336.1 GRRM system radical SAM/SPASM domain protein [Bradyrhizobium sp. CSS354]